MEEYICSTILSTPIVICIEFLEEAPQAEQFWCINDTKTPNIQREIKY